MYSKANSRDIFLGRTTIDGVWARATELLLAILMATGLNLAEASPAGASPNDATLSYLGISEGTLVPAFVSTTANYTDNVEAGVSFVTVTPTASDPSRATIRVLGRTVISGSPYLVELSASTVVIDVVVTAGDGHNTMTYYVAVYRAPSSDAALSFLAIIPGSLTPVFSSNTTSYSANVTSDTHYVQLTPTVSEPHATVKINGDTVASGSSSNPIGLNAGSNPIQVAVTAEDGSTTMTYVVNVMRPPSIDATLSQLAISAGTLVPAFTSNVTGYSDNVASSVNFVYVTPTVTESHATVKVNDKPVISGRPSALIALNAGGNAVGIVVTAEDGTTTTSYTVTVNRAPSNDATLSYLDISAGMLTPAFSSYITEYVDNVTSDVYSIAVTPVVHESHATVTVDSTPVPSGGPSQLIDLSAGPNLVSIQVTAEDGTSAMAYSVTINRPASTDAALSSLVISNGTITPPFASGTTNYTANVTNGVTSLSVTATANERRAITRINGAVVASGAPSSPINLNVGVNTIHILVTAENTSFTREYTVMVDRAASSVATLAGLAMSAGGLTPVFAANTANYTATVTNDISSVTVTPLASENHATVLVNNVAVASGSPSQTIGLNVGANTIDIQVTAQDRITSANYVLTVTRAQGAPAPGPGGGGIGGGFAGGGGGGGGVPSGPGVTVLTPYTNGDGLFNLATKATSEDNRAVLTIDKGVVARAKDGTALKSVSILPAAASSNPGDARIVIGSVYNLGPDAATFDPSISLTLSYDPAILPAGLPEKNLTVATWDPVASKWVELNTVIDAAQHTATASIGHFSSYVILANARPASFRISGLSVAPAEVDPGTLVTVTAEVGNSGELSDRLTLALGINGVTEATMEVSLPGGGRQTATFSVTRASPGWYWVDVNGTSGSFSVRQPRAAGVAAFESGNLDIAPGAAAMGEAVTISYVVTNTGSSAGAYNAELRIDDDPPQTKTVLIQPGERQLVAFSCTAARAGVHTVNGAGLSGSFQVKESAKVPARGVNWFLVGGAISAIIAVAASIYLLRFRRRPLFVSR